MKNNKLNDEVLASVTKALSQNNVFLEGGILETNMMKRSK